MLIIFSKSSHLLSSHYQSAQAISHLQAPSLEDLALALKKRGNIMLDAAYYSPS